MSRRERKHYVFETSEQWGTCLFHAADRFTTAARAGLHPQRSFAYEAQVFPAPGVRAPAVTPAGEFLWHDDRALLRALPGDEGVERSLAPWAMGQSCRMVALRDTIWVAGEAPGTLECFDLRMLTRLQVLDIEHAEVLDLAADGRNALLVLVRRPGIAGPEYALLQFDCGGQLATLVRLESGLLPAQLAVLPERAAAPAHIFLLAADRATLYGLARGAANPAWTLHLGSLSACFTADWLASDGRSRVLLAGRDGAQFSATPRVLALDGEATLIDALQLGTVATGIAAGPQHLIVTTAEGAEIHDYASVAGDAVGINAELLTPLLTAPDTAAALKWQRVDVWATLPAGTTLEVRYGWIDDPAGRGVALCVADDANLSQAQRLWRIEDLVEHWSPPVVFLGDTQSAARTDAGAAPYSLPLQDARVAQLWLHVTLRAAPRAALPALTRMHVSYAQSSLLGQLPAVYRRTAEQPGDFLGALVGILEATTDELDRRIAGLGALVHPDTAPVPWLDEIAEWLGVPWDDALAPAQKRALLNSAARLAEQRGTREGLAALLECLFPGSPPRFRITDVDVDYGFISLGGKKCRGTALPGVLAGLPATATVLSRKTILGRARLPCPGREPSATAHLTGRLRIDLTTSSVEMRAAQKWVSPLINAVVPANLRVDLRWHLLQDASFGGAGELPAAPLAHLGVDAVTGYARLPPANGGNLLM